ncbi:MAG: rhodanese-like domain-containing protein [Myxococcaceae bacterium]|nr:rhodanese-like domain-containing protein [Myxococcaceae bacterium]
MDSSWLQWALPALVIVAFLVFKRLGQVSRDEAHRLVKEGAKLVDVRSAMEFTSGHIPGAINVPLQELGSRAQKLGPKDKPVVLYCASGTRSAMARSTLKGLGFTQVFNLGSMGRW